MPSRSIHVVPNGWIILQYILRHLGCFHVLAVVNMGVQISLWHPVFISFGHIPGSGFAASYSCPIFNFWGSSVLFSIVAASIYILIDRAQGIPFLHILPTLLLSFDVSHSNRCEMISHCSFDLHFPDNWWCWVPFHVPVGHLYVFFGKNVYSVPLLPLFFSFLAVLGLRCCAWAFSSCGERGLLFVVVCGLLLSVVSLVVEHGF